MLLEVVRWRDESNVKTGEGKGSSALKIQERQAKAAPTSPIRRVWCWFGTVLVFGVGLHKASTSTSTSTSTARQAGSSVASPLVRLLAY